MILEVRVLEASRSALHDLGLTGNVQNNSFQFATGTGLLGNDPAKGVLGLTGGAGHTTIDAHLPRSKRRGLFAHSHGPTSWRFRERRRASWPAANFHIPCLSHRHRLDTGSATIVFRTYGVKLDFKPEVQDNGLIRLEVAPEVSKLDLANALRANGFTVPGLITRNTNTVVELRSGEALAIGGLFQRDYQNDVRQFPGVSEIPVLSALFRSARWRRAETELVILVTPRLAPPQDFSPEQIRDDLPGKEVSTSDLLLRGRSLDRPIAPDSPKIAR